MSTVRQRKGIVSMIQELDAFPKVEDDHRETTVAGGGVSLFVFGLIIVLVLSEISHFMRDNVQYNYEIDPDFDKKLKLNVDIMVAMKCSHVGADILDQTGDAAETFGTLREESVDFDLRPEQEMRFRTLRMVNDHLRANFLSLQKNIWSSAFRILSPEDDDEGAEEEEGEGGKETKKKRKNHSFISLIDIFPLIFDEHDGSSGEKGACRFRGTLEVNKVAGNFHITAGKSVPVLPRGHAHLSFTTRESEYNFSHRIFHLSFGDKDFTVINPIDGEEKITTDSNHLFQYFVQVVPTVIKSTFSSLELFQYAATEQNRTINHSKGSHGLPGIFIKYDLSPLRVTVTERSGTVVQLLVKLCAIIGGVFVTTGITHRILSGGFHLACCGLGVRSMDPPELPRHRPHSLSNDDLPETPLLSLSEATDHSLTLSEKVPFRDL